MQHSDVENRAWVTLKMERDIKIQVLFELHKSDFSAVIQEHYTTVERLCSGQDSFDYKEIKTIAKRQFTGVINSNNQEIYEGDIVQWGDDINEVVIFNNDDGTFCTETSMLCKSTMKVIGDVYRNPELISKSA